jgi:hypothetical protein
VNCMCTGNRLIFLSVRSIGKVRKSGFWSMRISRGYSMIGRSIWSMGSAFR